MGMALRMVLLTAFLVSCGEKDDSESKNKVRAVPEVTPIYDASTPDSFRGVALTEGELTHSTNLRYFFERTAPSGLSGTNRSGVIRGILQDIDERIGIYAQKEEGAEDPSCVLETPTTANFIVDTGVGNTMAMKFGCRDLFNASSDDKSGDGSGMAYGKDETNHYLATILTQTADPTNQIFGFFATINIASNAMDVVFLDSWLTGGRNRVSFMRILADPATETFQFTGAGVVVGYGPDINNPITAPYLTFQGGSRIASNASQVIVQGTACGTDEDGNCQALPQDLNVDDVFLDYTEDGTCFSSVDFSETPGSCGTLTFSPNIPLVAASAFASSTVQATVKASLSLSSLATLKPMGD